MDFPATGAVPIRRLCSPVCLAGLAALAALAGCTEQPSNPAAPVPAASARSLAATAAGFRPNSEKYRDQGARPATGRSGSAALEVRSLLARDGTAFVEATSGSLELGTAPGEIAKVQAKLTSMGGAKGTVNYNGLDAGGYWSHTYPGFARGDAVRLQANVRGIDGNRTDVVTVSTTTMLRPDLAAISLSGPSTAPQHMPITFTAVVSELNRDVGARANCVLREGSITLAQSTGIWVDAGGTVSCSFVKAFSVVGRHDLTVSASEVVPGDWNDANNSASASITIAPPNTPIPHYSAYAFRLALQISFVASNDDGSYPFSQRLEQKFNYSSAAAYGYLPGVYIEFPLQRAMLDVTSGGTIAPHLFTSGFHQSYQSGDNRYDCWTSYQGDYSASACSELSYGQTASWFSASRADGEATYFDEGYDCYAYYGTGCREWRYNDSYVYGDGTPLEFGSNVLLNAAWLDASGHPYTIDADVPLVDYSSEPWINSAESSCYADWRRSGTTCYSRTYSGRYFYGSVTVSP